MSTVSVEIKGKEDVSTAAKKAADGLGGVGKAAAGMAAALGPVAIATAVVIATIREVAKVVDECVTEFAANERAAIAFNAAIAQSGTISVAAGNALAKFAEEIADMTGETGESVQSMETLLVTSGRTEGEVRKLISAAVDMSAATGKDLRTSVEELNKTFSGTEGRMGQLIPELQSLTKEQLAAGAAVDVVAEKYRGMGDALQESTDVSIKNYQNAMDDLKASLGGLISLGLSPLRDWLTDIVRQWGEAASAARNYATAQAKIKGGKGVDTLAEVELEALNKKKLAYIEELKAIRSGSREGGDMYKLQTQEIDRVIAEQTAIAEALRNFSLDRAFQKYNPGAAPALPGAGSGSEKGSGGKSDAEKAWEDFVKANRVGWREIESGINDVIKGLTYPDTSRPSDRAISVKSGKMDEDFGGGVLSGGFDLFGGASMDPLTLIFEPLMDGIIPLVESLSMVKAILDPVGTIIAGVMDILGPLIETLLTPLVGIFRILGQTLGRIIAPLFEALGPIIRGIADVFVWLYNKVLMPVGNGVIALFNYVANLVIGIWNGIAQTINYLLGWAGVNLSYGQTRSLDQGALTAISVGDLAAAGAASSTTTGANASYSQARDVTVNVSVTTSALVGDDGIRQFSLMIWREIKSAGVLGAA